MRPARTLAWSKTHRYLGRCNGSDPSSRRQFCPDCIIPTPGYDFQEGQGFLPCGTMQTRWPSGNEFRFHIPADQERSGIGYLRNLRIRHAQVSYSSEYFSPAYCDLRSGLSYLLSQRPARPWQNDRLAPPMRRGSIGRPANLDRRAGLANRGSQQHQTPRSRDSRGRVRNAS
jgi:hypothetical protein